MYEANTQLAYFPSFCSPIGWITYCDWLCISLLLIPRFTFANTEYFFRSEVLRIFFALFFSRYTVLPFLFLHQKFRLNVKRNTYRYRWEFVHQFYHFITHSNWLLHLVTWVCGFALHVRVIDHCIDFFFKQRIDNVPKIFFVNLPTLIQLWGHIWLDLCSGPKIIIHCLDRKFREVSDVNRLDCCFLQQSFFSTQYHSYPFFGQVPLWWHIKLKYNTILVYTQIILTLRH